MISRKLFASLALMLMLLCGVVWGNAVCHAAGAQATTNAAAKRPFVLVIDAGHGGKDAGAVGQLTKEKDINLNVALALGRLVERNCPDVKVIYTRKTDVFVTLQGRADIANRNKANLFISVHTNSTPPGKAAPMGAETYTLGMHRAADNLEVAKRENSVITQESNYKQTYHNFDPRKSESYIIFEFMQDRNMQQSVDLARAIQRHYTASGRRNKGVHQAGFLVLRATSMPSVLTELGFISNPEEERFLHSREGVETLARSIFEGFKAYRQKHHAQDVPADVSSNDEDEAQPLVAENVPSAEPASPTSATNAQASAKVSPLDMMRNTVAASQPVDVSTLKAELVPVPTRPFGQPAAPVEKSQGETAKVIALPTFPPAVADSATPLPSQPAPQDTLVPVIPTAPQVAQAEVATPQTTLKVEQTAQELKKTEPAPQATAQPTKATAEKVKTAKKETKVSTQETKTTATTTKATVKEQAKTAEARPVFKVQLFTIDHALRSDDRHFKGLTPVEYYEEGGRYKYTYGTTANYEEAKRLKAEIADRFPDAFVVAFFNNQRTELAEAIKLSKQAANGKK